MTRMTNRLANEASPYLLQHKDNPVDWYPWSDEALEVARAQDKPILLSIGYAACHWCHVMERESFEDEETAALMNENFINIKVDREERPDIDSLYMDAVQAMTGHGGWPMTMFLTPEGTPFYGGTYFPPVDRHGMPSFRTVLEAVAEAWRDRRDEARQQGKRLLEHVSIGSRLRPSQDLVSDDVLQDALRSLRNNFDETFGGFGGAPKFPQPMGIDLLLRLAHRGHEEARTMAAKTLDMMAAGGIFDQLGGGWHRYSVDREWVVPHFEKMLYDNAQLLRTYARSYLLDGNPRHREVAEATARWMLTEMRDPAGGFWSSLDADSEGEEGRFYVWSLDEVADVAGEDLDLAVETWGFSETGNFEGHNIPVRTSGDPETPDVERLRLVLLERRASRVRPGTDDKVLTAWSSLAASCLAEAGATLGHRDWVAAAVEAVDFSLSTMRTGGRLMRSYRSTGAGTTIKHLAVCEDYAFLLEACLALFEATHDTRWLFEARWAADEAIRLFWDAESGGFFTTGSDVHDLVVRPKDLFDNAIPAANSVLALELQRLALLTGEASYESHALGAIRLVRDAATRSPQGFGHALQAIDFYLSDALEIVIVGDGAPGAALVDTIRSRFLPNKVLVVQSSVTPEAAALVPLLRDRTLVDGLPTAYVCRHGTCKLPVTRPEELLDQISAA